MAKFVCFGEVLGRLGSMRGGRLDNADKFQFYTGGAEANVASLLARLGHSVKLISVLPEGPLGDRCLRELSSHNVDISGIVRSEGRLGLYFSEAGAMMRPAKVIYDRADSTFCGYDFNAFDWPLILDGCDWLHVSGITLALGEAPARSALRAAKTAQANGVKVSFDCNYRAALWHGREQEIVPVMKDMVGLADCLFAGRRDARYLLDQEIVRPDATANFASVCSAYVAQWPNLRHIASTYREILSADHNRLTGRYWDGGELHVSPAHDLENIVDRIGGGDAFSAGILHQISMGKTGQDVIGFATASAAIKHTISGDINRTDTDEISAIMNQSNSDISR